MATSLIRAIMAMPFRSSASALLLLLGASAAHGGAPGPTQSPTAVAHCPARLETMQSAVAPEGWSADRIGAAKPLAEIGFFDGPVGEQVQLAPSSETKRGTRRISTWTFAATERPVRMACFYRGTDIVLSQPLPAAVRHCTITADSGTPGPGSVACR
jgi:hypothetical protein